MRRVGPDVLPLPAAELGLTRTRIVGGPRQLLESMYAEVGVTTDDFARIFPARPASRVARPCGLPSRT